MGKQQFDVSALFDDAYPERVVVFQRDDGLRLDRFLSSRLKWMSRSQAQKLIFAGAVSSPTGRFVGTLIKSSTKVAEEDIFDVLLPQFDKDLEASRKDPPLNKLEVIFEDEHLLVINKPAGVPVHPVGKNLHRTVLTALHKLYRKPDDPDNDVVPKLLHRLDMETSGVLLLSKNEASTADLSIQFRSKRVRKTYLALVYGRMEQSEGEITLPLGDDDNSRVPYKQTVRAEGGKPARTVFKVLEEGERVSLVLLELHTGKKHQLRVHLAAIGNPIVGDKMYGLDENYFFKAREGPPSAEDLKVLLLPRQALHSYQLTVVHPVLKKEMTFEAPAPEVFYRLLKST